MDCKILESVMNKAGIKKKEMIALKNNIRLEDIAVQDTKKTNGFKETPAEIRRRLGASISTAEAQALAEHDKTYKEVSKHLDEMDLQFDEGSFGDTKLESGFEKAKSPMAVLMEVQEDGSMKVKDAVKRVLTFTLMDWTANASQSENRDEDIRKLLGIAEDEEIPMAAYEALKNVTGTAQSGYERAGSIAMDNLGLRFTKMNDIREDKLKINLGQTVLMVADKMGKISLDVKSRNKNKELVSSNKYESGYKQYKKHIFGSYAKSSKSKEIATYKVIEEEKSEMQKSGSKGAIDQIVAMRRNVKTLAGIVEAKSEAVYPSFEKQSEYEDVQIKGRVSGFVDTDTMHEKAVKKMRTVPYKFDEDVMRVFSYLSENNNNELLEALWYTSDLDTVHITEREGASGKNRAVLEEIAYAVEWYRQWVENDKKPFYFDYTVNASNIRFTTKPNTFDIQNKTLHRFMTYTHEETITKKNMQQFMEGVGQALGLDVDKQTGLTTEKQFHEKAVEILEKYEDEVAQIRKDYKKVSLEDAKMQARAKLTLEAMTKKRGGPADKNSAAHKMQGMTAMFKYLDSAGMPFKSTIALETDAITSGYILKMLQMPIFRKSVNDAGSIGVDIEKVKIQLRKGGVIADGEYGIDTKKLGAVLKDHGIEWSNKEVIPFVALAELGGIVRKGKQKKYAELSEDTKKELGGEKGYIDVQNSLADAYEHPAKQVANELTNSMSPKYHQNAKGNVPKKVLIKKAKRNKLFIDLIGTTEEDEAGNWSAKLTRAFMKGPFMIFNYGAGTSKIVNNKVNEMMYRLYHDSVKDGGKGMLMMAEILDNSRTYPVNKNTEKAIDEAITESKAIAKDMSEAKTRLEKKDARTKALNFKLKPAVEKQVRKTAVDVISEPISKVFNSEYAELIEATSAINNSMVVMFKIFKRRVDKEIDKIKIKEGRDATDKEIEQIVLRLGNKVPAIKTALGNDNEVTERLMIVDSEPAAYDDTVNTKDGQKKLDETGATYLKTGDGTKVDGQAMRYKLVEAYSQGGVLGIHNIDSSIQAVVLSAFEALGIHDANIFGLKDVEPGSRAYNKAVIEIAKKYSLTTAVMDALNANMMSMTEEEIKSVDAEVVTESLERRLDGLPEDVKEDIKKFMTEDIQESDTKGLLYVPQTDRTGRYLEDVFNNASGKGAETIEKLLKSYVSTSGIKVDRLGKKYAEMKVLQERSEEGRYQLYNNTEMHIDHTAYEASIYKTDKKEYVKQKPKRWISKKVSKALEVEAFEREVMNEAETKEQRKDLTIGTINEDLKMSSEEIEEMSGVTVTEAEIEKALEDGTFDEKYHDLGTNATLNIGSEKLSVEADVYGKTEKFKSILHMAYGLALRGNGFEAVWNKVKNSEKDWIAYNIEKETGKRIALSSENLKTAIETGYKQNKDVVLKEWNKAVDGKTAINYKKQFNKKTGKWFVNKPGYPEFDSVPIIAKRAIEKLEKKDYSDDIKFQVETYTSNYANKASETKIWKDVKNILLKVYPNIQLNEITNKEIESTSEIKKYDYKIKGQADLKAMSVLINTDIATTDTLSHEYAHHYIHWFRDAPIVQKAIKKWGNEEALVQAIGEQVVKQKGKAYGWWKKFGNWIRKLYSSLSSTDKEELKNLLTDAFLEKKDLMMAQDILMQADIENKLKANDTLTREFIRRFGKKGEQLIEDTGVYSIVKYKFEANTNDRINIDPSFIKKASDDELIKVMSNVIFNKSLSKEKETYKLLYDKYMRSKTNKFVNELVNNDIKKYIDSLEFKSDKYKAELFIYDSSTYSGEIEIYSQNKHTDEEQISTKKEFIDKFGDDIYKHIVKRQILRPNRSGNKFAKKTMNFLYELKIIKNKEEDFHGYNYNLEAEKVFSEYLNTEEDLYKEHNSTENYVENYVKNIEKKYKHVIEKYSDKFNNKDAVTAIIANYESNKISNIVDFNEDSSDAMNSSLKQMQIPRNDARDIGSLEEYIEYLSESNTNIYIHYSTEVFDEYLKGEAVRHKSLGSYLYLTDTRGTNWAHYIVNNYSHRSLPKMLTFAVNSKNTLIDTKNSSLLSLRLKEDISKVPDNGEYGEIDFFDDPAYYDDMKKFKDAGYDMLIDHDSNNIQHNQILVLDAKVQRLGSDEDIKMFKEWKKRTYDKKQHSPLNKENTDKEVSIEIADDSETTGSEKKIKYGRAYQINSYIIQDLRTARVKLRGKWKVVSIDKVWLDQPGVMKIRMKDENGNYGIYSFTAGSEKSLSSENNKSVAISEDIARMTDEFYNAVSNTVNKDGYTGEVVGSEKKEDSGLQRPGVYAKSLEEAIEIAKENDKERYENEDENEKAKRLEKEAELIKQLESWKDMFIDIDKIKIKIYENQMPGGAYGEYSKVGGNKGYDNASLGEIGIELGELGVELANGQMMELTGNEHKVRNEMSAVEVLVHETKHAITEWAMNPENMAAAKPRMLLQRIYEQARKKTTWESFLPEDIDGMAEEVRKKEIYKAKELYKYVFGLDENRRIVKGWKTIDGYKEFVAHMGTNEYFTKAMDSIKLEGMNIKEDDKRSWMQKAFDKFFEMIAKAIDRVFKSIDGIKVGDSVYTSTERLVAQMIVAKDRQNHKAYQKGVIGQAEKLLDKASGAVELSNEKLVPLVNKAIEAVTGTSDSFITIKEAEKLAKDIDKIAGGVAKAERLAKGKGIIAGSGLALYKMVMIARLLPKMRRLMNGEHYDEELNERILKVEILLMRAVKQVESGAIKRMFKDFLSGDEQMNVITDHMQKTKAALDKIREEASTSQVASIKNGFKNLDITDDRNEHYNIALTKAILRTDVQSLNIKAKELKILLENEEDLTKAVAEEKEAINAITLNDKKLGQYMVEDADYMVDYMVNGVGIRTTARKIALGLENYDIGIARVGNTKESVDKHAAMIDRYASLKALQMLDAGSKKTIIELIEKDETGVDRFIKTAEVLQRNDIREEHEDMEYSHSKGQIRDTYKRTTDIQYIVNNEVSNKELQDKGYVFKHKIHANDGDKSGDINVWVKEEAVFTSLADGAMLMKNKLEFGYSLRKKIFLGEKYKTKQEKKKAFNSAMIKMINQWKKGGSDRARMTAMPVFNHDGMILDFAYHVPTDVKESKLTLEQKATTTIAHTYGLYGTSTTIEKENKLLVDFLVQDFEENGMSDIDNYIEVKPDKVYNRSKVGSKERSDTNIFGDTPIGQMWAKIPLKTREYIKDKVGSNKLYVRKDLAMQVFGYTELGLAESKFIKNLVGKKHIEKVRVADELWMNSVSLAKNTLIVKLPRAAINNSKSNFNLMVLQGFNPVRVTKELWRALRTLKPYENDVKELNRLKQKRKGGEYAYRIKELETRIAMNPHHRLVSKGMLQSIVDDVDLGIRNDNLLESKIKRITKKLPKFVQKTLDIAFLTSGTGWYKFMERSLMLGDYLFKFATESLVKEKAMNRPSYIKGKIEERLRLKGLESKIEGIDWKKKVTDADIIKVIEEIAERTAIDNHINYPKLLSAGMSALDKRGAAPFIKFWLRIQKVNADIIRNHPTEVMLYMLTQYIAGDMSDTLDSLGAPNMMLNPADILADVPAREAIMQLAKELPGI